MIDTPSTGLDAANVQEKTKLPGAFVAYSSLPLDRSETIEKAISVLQADGVVDIVGWKTLKVAGRLVLASICEEIRNREIFVADLTGLNPNVLFELGYAIAHKKRVWLVLNPKIERARLDFDRFQILTTVGYSPYNNSHEIVSRFYKDEPYKTLNNSLFDELLNTAGPASKKNALLYLRCDVETEATIRLARRVSSGPIRSVIDDPKEVRVQPLSWYVQQTSSAFAVVCHFLSTDYGDWELLNAKHALVAGLAYGQGKPLLMLAHEPYSSPLDYRDLLRKHKTAESAEAIFAEWSVPYIEQYEKRIASEATFRAGEKAKVELRDITVGEPVAEFESDKVSEYFVETSIFTDALKSKNSIVVGRKGTGKTATLYALTEVLSADPRNHNCVIKPVGYELEGLLVILEEELGRAEKGYLVESFWKFLIYTELTKSVYDQLLAKPEFYMRSVAEKQLCEFIEVQKSLIAADFSMRLESIVGSLRALPEMASGESRRLKISELLHTEMLARLRVLLGRVLATKSKVTLMVDNLDKAWDAKGKLRSLSDLLFGLLSVSRRITEEFGHDASGKSPVNLHFVLFLRSDIYAAMLEFAKERDKLPVRHITWDDPELLKRVIEERFMKSGADISLPQEVWEKFFVPTVAGIPTWEYIGNKILPRPRDLIYFVKAAMQFTVNRGHSRVDEKDFVGGGKNYSRFALDSLIVEASARIPNVEDLLLRFLGSSEVINEQEIFERLGNANIPSGEFEEILILFAELTFIGFEVSPNRFEFLYDERDLRKLMAMAVKTGNETTNGVRRFCIHPAFHSFLDIISSPSRVPGQMTIDLQ
jgi:hypothetical protein